MWLAMLLMAFSIVSCNTNNDDDPQGEDNRFYVQFTIGQDTILYEDGVNNYGNGPGISTYEDSIGRLHSQHTTFIRSALDPNYEDDILSIQMVKFFLDTNYPTYETDFLMFDEGTYSYGLYTTDSSTAGVSGAIITYTDGDGKVWSSDIQYGTQQAWNSFAITEHKAVDETQFGAKTRGTFNCRVFDGLGSSLDLRNGEFHARTIYRYE